MEASAAGYLHVPSGPFACTLWHYDREYIVEL
jgi:hypothetical protein